MESFSLSKTLIIELLNNPRFNLFLVGEYGNHYQGDIILEPSQINVRNGRIDRKRWENGIFVYEIDPSLTMPSMINIAMSRISSASCIRFKLRSNEPSYTSFQVS